VGRGPTTEALAAYWEAEGLLWGPGSGREVYRGDRAASHDHLRSFVRQLGCEDEQITVD
jgi:hypothetical protein